MEVSESYDHREHVYLRTPLAAHADMEFPLLAQLRGRLFFCRTSLRTTKAGEMPSVQRNDIARLDQLVEELGKETGPQCEALREHLKGARVYLAGLMPSEYALSLKMAEEALDCLSNPDLRKRIDDFIKGT